jgi:3-hydroxyacyl-[acyl-carrier-protein] dehydratase
MAVRVSGRDGCGMRFRLIDQILEVVPGERIKAVKNLTLGEEYLADHFPTFPVMPGVLMLEALVQAGAWLMRATRDFQHSIVVLKEARGVKYGSFVEPGRQLKLTVEISDKNAQDSEAAAFKGTGEVDGVSTVSARFTLRMYNLRDRRPEWAELDERLIHDLKREFATLRPGAS